MKPIKIFAIPLLGLWLIFSLTSCAVYNPKDSGRHKTWSNNPKDHKNVNYMNKGKSNSRNKN